MYFSLQPLAFGIFINGCEYGDELMGFVEQAGHPGLRDTTAFHQQFQPIPGFFDFFRESPTLEMNSGFDRPREASR